MSLSSTVSSLVKFAESLDCSCDVDVAQTGSRYIRVSHARLDDELVIRVADHGDAYCSSDYTCDGLEGTASGAKTFLLAALHTTDGARRRLWRLRRRMCRKIAAADRAAWVRKYAADHGVSEAEASRSCPLPKTIPWAYASRAVALEAYLGR